MKNTILRRILVAVALPLVVLYVFVEMHTYMVMTSFRERRWQSELESVTAKSIESVADNIDAIKGIAENAAHDISDAYIAGEDRSSVDLAVRKILMHNDVFNAWVAFEPNAYDGEDALHTSDYPGAPSGRLIRSYSRIDGKIVTVPDMDETTLDDPALSVWYTTPRKTGSFYYGTLVNNHGEYDYRLVDAPAFAVSLVAPIKDRAGNVIGCVGADVSGDYLLGDIIETTENEGVMIVIFDSEGQVLFSPVEEYKYAEIDTLQFHNGEKLKEAQASGEPVFIGNEYSAFLQTDALTYFMPVRGVDSLQGLGFYAAVPRALLYDELQTVIVLIAVSLMIVFIVVFLLVYLVASKVTSPIKKLTRAAREIADGNLQTVIPVSKSDMGEISELSTALYRMVEQFRIGIAQREQAKDIHLWNAAISDIISADMPRKETAAELNALFKKQFLASRVRIFAALPEKILIDILDWERLQYETELDAVSGGRMLSVYNYGALHQLDMSFILEDTIAVLIIRLMKEDGTAAGFIIIERNERSASSVTATEESLIRQSNRILANWMESVYCSLESQESETDASTRAETAEEPPARLYAGDSFFAAAEIVPGINVEYAYHLLDGQEEIYYNALRATGKQLKSSIERLKGFIASGDWGGYTIDIHGIKGSLNNIGATELGRRAAEFEKAAKAGDYALCAAQFEEYIGLLEAFRLELAGLFSGETAEKPRWEGELPLARVRELLDAVSDYDSLAAADIVRELCAFSFDETADASLETIHDRLEDFQYDTAEEEIQALLTYLELGDV